MVEKKAYSPVIIIGMHRSGTSLITQMLEELGLFVGKRIEENHEAYFFLSLNKWLLLQNGGTWDQPESIAYLINNQRVRSFTAAHLRQLVASPRIINYLGLKKYLAYRRLDHLDFPWGWKDPRNSFTMPIWLDIFPEARFIHVYRHGVDVAASLRKREKGQLDRLELGLEKLDLARRERQILRYAKDYILPPISLRRMMPSLRCLSLDGGIDLWESHLTQVRNHQKILEGRVIEVQYEEFVKEPYPRLKHLAAFCGLTIDEELIKNVSQKTKPDRIYAYKKDPELRSYAESLSSRLSKWGY